MAYLPPYGPHPTKGSPHPQIHPSDPFELVYGRPFVLSQLPHGPTHPLGSHLPLLSPLCNLLRAHANHACPSRLTPQSPYRSNPQTRCECQISPIAIKAQVDQTTPWGVERPYCSQTSRQISLDAPLQP